MFGEQVRIMDALFISLFSMVVVFIVLYLISFITDVVAFFINRKSKSKTINAKCGDLSNTNTLGSVDSRTVAAIAAAISVVTGTNPKKLIIKSIKRIKKWH